MDRSERIALGARAEAMRDCAHIIKNAYQHGAKAETEQEWLTMSYTFSNQAILIERRLAAQPDDKKPDPI